MWHSIQYLLTTRDKCIQLGEHLSSITVPKSYRAKVLTNHCAHLQLGLAMEYL